MATRAWDFGDYAADEPVAQVTRPVLRLVESAPAPKLMPPAWLVAPPFPKVPVMSVHEQANYYTVPAATAGAPYRSIREVPRAAW